MSDSPISYGESHRVANNHDGSKRITGQVPVAVNCIRDGDLRARGRRKRDDAHGEYDAKPVNMVESADAKENATERDENERRNHQPDTVFCFEKALVLAGHL